MDRLTCQQLQDALRSCQKRQIVVRERVCVRPNSDVFLATTDEGPVDRLAIKCCYQPGTDLPDQATAEKQFANLDSVSQALRLAGIEFRVPEPMFYEHKLGAYAMFWVEGQSLTDTLCHSYSRRRALVCFERVGRWLGAFHAAGPVRRESPDLTNQIRHLEALRAHPLDQRWFRAGLSLLDSERGALVQNTPSVSWLHGDCKSDNFLLAGGGAVFGIDVALAHENAVEIDLAMFLIDLALRVQTPRFVRFLPIQGELQEAFLKGYSRLGPTIDLAFLQWLRLWFALSRWHSYITEQRLGSLKRWYVNWVLARLVRRLVGTECNARLRAYSCAK